MRPMLPGSSVVSPSGDLMGTWGQFRGRMGSVKTPKGTETVAERIRLIRRQLNPHGNGELGWPGFAKFAGVSLGTAKKWESRDGISEDKARALAQTLTAAGYPCSWECIRHGTVPAPAWVAQEPGSSDDVPDRVGVLSDPKEHTMARQAEARPVSDALGRVVQKHEVVGVELRKVLIRMAGGLDALNHHE